MGRARAEPMTLPFSVTVMVKPVRIQVISANIKKYFTSIRGHGEHIDSPFSNENSLHRLPRPICIETEIHARFESHRSRFSYSVDGDGLINQTPRSRAFSKNYPTLMNDRESVKIIPLHESNTRLTINKKKKKGAIIPSTIAKHFFIKKFRKLSPHLHTIVRMRHRE